MCFPMDGFTGVIDSGRQAEIRTHLLVIGKSMQSLGGGKQCYSRLLSNARNGTDVLYNVPVRIGNVEMELLLLRFNVFLEL